MAISPSPRSLLLGLGAALSLSVCLSAPAGAHAQALEGVKPPGSAKASPYASAKDEDATPVATIDNAGQNPVETLGGTKAAGSRKDSPYAAAKDENVTGVEPTLNRLWAVLVPVGLAAGSYLWLRGRERGGLS